MKIRKQHDRFFKQLFNSNGNIRDFLSFALPENVLKEVDLSKIKIESSSDINEKLKEHISDIVIHTKTKDDESLDLYIIFEHKSYVDKRIFFQLIKYVSNIWQRDIKNKSKLRIVLPIVFYHGNKNWNIPTSLKELYSSNIYIKQYFNLEYILFDLTKVDIEKAYKEKLHKNILLATSLYSMKSTFKTAAKILKDIFTFIRKNNIILDKNSKIIIYNYLLESTDIDYKEFLEVIKEENEDDVMPSIAERLINKGEERERKKAEIKAYEKLVNTIINLNNNGVELKIIAKSLNITEEKVKKIIKENSEK